MSVVTPWRNSQELLDVRQALYSGDLIRRERAVNKIFAWRTRKPDGLPLLLDSTADIVDVVVQDEKCVLQHNALRLLYATALSRFITGLADTQIDLTRDRPSWFPPGKTIQLPLSLFEIRHRIVHRHLPSLSELKRAAQQSLGWLWEWYWSQLDYVFGIKSEDDQAEVESIEAIREKLQAILKTYVKERKNEIKARRKVSKAADDALSTLNLRYGITGSRSLSPRAQSQLLHLLVDERMILPADKKLGSNMSGAFMIWSPILLTLTQTSSAMTSVHSLLQRLSNSMNMPASSTLHVSMDPIREGLCGWIAHILSSQDWQDDHSSVTNKFIEDTLITCFSNPTHWNLVLAEQVVSHEGMANSKHWLDLLKAAKSDGPTEEMDVVEDDVSEEKGGEVKSVSKEKIRGPTKYIGLWKAKPIGWTEEGWEDEE